MILLLLILCNGFGIGCVARGVWQHDLALTYTGCMIVVSYWAGVISAALVASAEE